LRGKKLSLQRLLLLVLSLVSAFLAHAAGAYYPSLYPVLIGLCALVPFYAVLTDDLFLGVFSGASVATSLILMAISKSDPGWLQFCFVFVAVGAALLSYGWWWRQRIIKSEEDKQGSERRVSSLTVKAEERKQALRNMAVQLQDILRLFELAKELNECLSFDKAMHVLKDRIFDRVQFEKAVLLVFAGETLPPSVVRRFVISHEGQVEASDPETKGDLSGFEKKAIQKLCGDQQSHFFQHENELPEDWRDALTRSYPLWIFPLVVEERVIALFMVEGGDPNDEPRFRVIASQLALQVKKIKLYETVKELSIVDGLTRVFVRRHFMERFEEELKRTIRHDFSLSVLMLDIDHFKTYNDNYGHLVGDVTLREVSNVIRSTVRRVDIVARYGGEEFAIVLPETGEKGAAEVGERIRSRVAKKRFDAYDEKTDAGSWVRDALFSWSYKGTSGTPEADDALSIDPFLSRAKRGRQMIEDGRIAELWVTWDNLSGLAQLGLLPPPGAA